MYRRFISIRRGVLSVYPIDPPNYRNRIRQIRIGRVYNYIDQSRAYEHLRPSVSHINGEKSKCLTRHRNRFLSEEKSFRTINRRESPCEQPVCSYRLRGFLRKSYLFSRRRVSIGREIRHLGTRDD